MLKVVTSPEKDKETHQKMLISDKPFPTNSCPLSCAGS